MSIIYTEEYFQNKQEQAKIKIAINTAVPVGVHYHNLIIAMSELLKTYVEEAYKDEVFSKPVDLVNGK